MGLTVISGPVLSRLIGPFAYGIVAPAQSVGSLGLLLSQSGFSYYTVTDKTVTAEDARDLHRQSLILSLQIAFLAALFAACFKGPFELRGARALFALTLVALTGASAVPIAWGQRNGRFAAIEWWGVGIQAFVTFCVAIPLAFGGFGLVAVNANLLLPTFFALIVAWNISRLRSAQPRKKTIPTPYRLGSLSSNLGSYLAGNVDTLLLATYFSPVALGVYSRANMLASLPGTVVSAAIAKVGLVALSKSEEWSDHRSFLWKATALTLAAFSALALVAGLGLDVTALAFGKKFATTPSAFAVLTLSQIFFYGGSLLDTYLVVRKRMTEVGISHCVQAALSAIGFIALRPSSLLAIAWILLIPAAIRYVFLIALVNRERGTLLRPRVESP